MAALLEKKHRDRTGQFLIEGVHLVQEALLAGADVQSVVYKCGTRHSPGAKETPSRYGLRHGRGYHWHYGKMYRNGYTASDIWHCSKTRSMSALLHYSKSSRLSLCSMVCAIQAMRAPLSAVQTLSVQMLLSWDEAVSTYIIRRRYARQWGRFFICLLLKETWRSFCQKRRSMGYGLLGRVCKQPPTAMAMIGTVQPGCCWVMNRMDCHANA